MKKFHFQPCIFGVVFIFCGAPMPGIIDLVMWLFSEFHDGPQIICETKVYSPYHNLQRSLSCWASVSWDSSFIKYVEKSLCFSFFLSHAHFELFPRQKHLESLRVYSLSQFVRKAKLCDIPLCIWMFHSKISPDRFCSPTLLSSKYLFKLWPSSFLFYISSQF
jgi:hypothetical protein